MVARTVIEIPGLGHGANPIPLAVKIGQMVFTGSIMGTNPESHETPKDAAEQIALAFRNMQRIIEKAGGTTANIGKVEVALKDMSHREIVNGEWTRMFPDEHSRPVRHTSRSDMAGDLLIQMQMTAVLDS